MINIKEYEISPLNALCQIVNQELDIIKNDLVEAGNGDTITLEVISGGGIDNYYINSDHELYVKFNNGDVLKGDF